MLTKRLERGQFVWPSSETTGRIMLSSAQLEGFAQPGDEIVVAAGIPFGQSGTTNTLRVAKVG